MARELARVISVKPCEVSTDEPELRQAAAQLRNSDYDVCADVSFAIMSEQRRVYRCCVDALANHLGKPTTMLVRQE